MSNEWIITDRTFGESNILEITSSEQHVSVKAVRQSSDGHVKSQTVIFLDKKLFGVKMRAILHDML